MWIRRSGLFSQTFLKQRSLWIHNIMSSSKFLIVKILCMCWPNNRSLTFAYLFDPNNPLVIPAQLVSILCSVQVCSDQTWSVLIEPSKGEHLCCKIFLPLIIKRIRYWLILPTWSCMLRESKHYKILGLFLNLKHSASKRTSTKKCYFHIFYADQMFLIEAALWRLTWEFPHSGCFATAYLRIP